MEPDALILLLVLLVGMLTFSYQGYRMLHLSGSPSQTRSLAGSARETVIKPTKSDATDARRALERFDDDGGHQVLSKDAALTRLEWVAGLFMQQDKNEYVKQCEKRCSVCEKKYPERG